MIVKKDNSELISIDFKVYLLKKMFCRYLLNINLIDLEEYEKSIVQITKKYNGKEQ